MEPILTLPYSEWLVAEKLARLFPAREGYALYAPLSRQQKGVDLIIARRANRITRSASVQIKFSRAYEQPPNRAFRFGTWFTTFAVPEEADFVILSTIYPATDGRGVGKSRDWWAPMFLLFTFDEMKDFIANVKTRGGTRDRMFGFGFSSPDHVLQIRGDQHREGKEFTSFLLQHRVALIVAELSQTQTGRG